MGFSVHLEHLFSAVRRVANETLTCRINDEIKQFQRNLADQYWAIIRDFRNVDRAFSPLDGQTNGTINLECGKSRARSSCPSSQGREIELIDERPGHREGRGARIN